MIKKPPKMRMQEVKAGILLIVLPVLFLTGCADLNLELPGVPVWPGASIHPLFTEKYLVFEDQLLGKWKSNDDLPLTFKQFDANSYKLISDDQAGGFGTFQAHLTKINNMLFLDMAPIRTDSNSLALSDMLFLQTHIFAKIESIEPTLQMRFIELDPNVLKHEIVQEIPIFTASTEELRQFMKEYTYNKYLPGEIGKFQKLEQKDPCTHKPNITEPYHVGPKAADPNRKQMVK